MKSWEFSVTRKDEKNQVILRTITGPAWAMALYKTFWGTTYVCDFLHKFTLPKFIRNWKSKWDDGDFEAMTFEEYYGDDFSVFWHLSVEAWAINEGINFCNRFLKYTDVEVSLDVAEQINGEPLVWIREWFEEDKEDAFPQ